MLLFAAAALLGAQQYDIVLHGGHIIDPANNLDAVADVAISGARIVAVKADIPKTQARRVLDVRGLYVVPGLIDLHAHVFGYKGSLLPDDTQLVTGTTTVVDAGGSGWRTFGEFRRTVIAHSKTRVLALLNIVGAGMVGDPAESNTADMEPAKTAETIEHNRDVIVGIKTAHFALPGWTAIDRAVEAGRLAKVPVLVDDRITTGMGRTSREELLEHLRPGDAHTHMYNDRQNELVNRFTGKVQPYMFEARRRGVLFDLGHGAGSFLWPVASRAMAQGFMPDTISTDLHSTSILMQQATMPECISKLMLLGMSLPDAIMRSTLNPAKFIGRYPEIGTLGVGKGADIAVFELKSGVFAFKDSWGAKRLGNKRLVCAMTIRDGQIVYQREDRPSTSSEQQIFDLLLKNAHVIDPANRRDGRFDVAIIGNKIARIAPGLPAAHARVTIEASAYYTTPGLIDIGAGVSKRSADYQTLPFGVTTTVGASQTNDTISSPDTGNMTATMSGFLSQGMAFDRIIERVTINAARAIQRSDLGKLSEGAAADIAMFELIENRSLRCVLTIRNGVVVWDSEGLSAPDWIQAGPYSNFK